MRLLLDRGRGPSAAEMWDYKREVDPLIERALGCHLPGVPTDAHKLFNEALHYADFPGGKRRRPSSLCPARSWSAGGPRTFCPRR